MASFRTRMDVYMLALHFARTLPDFDPQAFLIAAGIAGHIKRPAPGPENLDLPMMLQQQAS